MYFLTRSLFFTSFALVVLRSFGELEDFPSLFALQIKCTIMYDICLNFLQGRRLAIDCANKKLLFCSDENEKKSPAKETAREINGKGNGLG